MKEEESYSPKETALRRDAVIKNMIATPPTPHKPLGESKPKRGSGGPGKKPRRHER